MSTSKELEELQNKKARLEEESSSLKKEQQDLEERVKILEEKIAVEELKNGNKATSETISNLKSKIDELEQRLRQVTQTPVTLTPTKETIPKIGENPEPTIQTELETVVTISEEPEEDAVTVAAIEDSTEVPQEEISEEFSRRNEKRKCKFF